jgi:hypothetical protein
MNQTALIIWGIGIGYATARAYDGKWGFAAFVLVATIAYISVLERWIAPSR